MTAGKKVGRSNLEWLTHHCRYHLSGCRCWRMVVQSCPISRIEMELKLVNSIQVDRASFRRH